MYNPQIMRPIAFYHHKKKFRSQLKQLESSEGLHVFNSRSIMKWQPIAIKKVTKVIFDVIFDRIKTSKAVLLFLAFQERTSNSQCRPH